LPVDLARAYRHSICRDLLAWLGVEQTRRRVALRSSISLFCPRTMPMVNPFITCRHSRGARRRPRILENHRRCCTGICARGPSRKASHPAWGLLGISARFAMTVNIRDELGPWPWPAQGKAWREFPPENVFLIGDTPPHDIACGKGDRCETTCLATGAFSVEELSALHPTPTFTIWPDTQELLKGLL